MWARNLLFLGLLGSGLAGLAGSLYPPKITGKPQAVLEHFAGEPTIQPVVDEINREFHRQWADQHLASAKFASDLTVARRLALALMGTIPSLEEIRRFETLSAGGQRWQTWLDEIFRDPRYADYMAERLARVFVGTEDGPFLVFRRRRFVSWLSDEIFRNRPYHHVVYDLIAGQGLWTDHPATNFVTVTIEPEKQAPNPERLAARVARAFLGIRLDCAQCHNHPFQPWKQTDFQSLAAYFGQVHQGFTGLVDGAGDYRVDFKKTGNPITVEPGVAFRSDIVPLEGNRREQLARWVTDPKNPALAQATVNRMWALLLGKPLVEPVDDLGSVPTLPRVLHLLADDLVAHDYDLRRLIRIMAATEVFHLDSAVEPEWTPAHEKNWAAFPMTRLRPEQVVSGIIQAASLETINQESPLLTRFFRAVGQNEFVKRYGDTGEDEFHGGGGTIPQQLLLLNGQMVFDKTKEDIFNASSRVSMLAPDDARAVETAFLIVQTRRPTPEESAYFEAKLLNSSGTERGQRVTDLIWTLINSTEFSWNH